MYQQRVSGKDHIEASKGTRRVRRNPTLAHLLIEINEGLVGQLQRLYGLQHRVPVPTVDVCHEALNAVHGVERHSGLLLKGGERPVEAVFLQVLHDEPDHAAKETQSTVSRAHGPRPNEHCP